MTTALLLSVSLSAVTTWPGARPGRVRVAGSAERQAGSQAVRPAGLGGGWSGGHGLQTLQMCPSPGRRLTRFLLGSNICALMLISIN